MVAAYNHQIAASCYLQTCSSAACGVAAGGCIQPSDIASRCLWSQEPSSSSLITSTPRATTVVSWSQMLEWARHWQLVPGSCNGGVEVPRGIGKTMALHNISVIDVSVASGHAILEELKNLTQLRKLGVSGINRENRQELCSAISALTHLKCLSMWLDKNQAGCLDTISCPPEELESLKLYRW